MKPVYRPELPVESKIGYQVRSLKKRVLNPQLLFVDVGEIGRFV